VLTSLLQMAPFISFLTARTLNCMATLVIGMMAKCSLVVNEIGDVDSAKDLFVANVLVTEV